MDRGDGARGTGGIVELRRYALHPGARETLIDLFDRELVEPQEAVGMRVLGQFRDLDDPDRFTWLRGFPDMASRLASLSAFYGGPAWAAHRDAANATMIDSDDVLLLRPVTPASGFVVDMGPRADAAHPDTRFVATLYALDAPVDPDFLAFFAARVHPAVAAAGARVIATLSTEYAEDTFPRLPVRTGEHVFAWFARFEDEAAHVAYRDALAASEAWRATAAELSRQLVAPPQALRLSPTSRSRLR